MKSNKRICMLAVCLACVSMLAYPFVPVHAEEVSVLADCGHDVVPVYVETFLYYNCDSRGHWEVYAKELRCPKCDNVFEKLGYKLGSIEAHEDRYNKGYCSTCNYGRTYTVNRQDLQ